MTVKNERIKHEFWVSNERLDTLWGAVCAIWTNSDKHVQMDTEEVIDLIQEVFKARGKQAPKVAMMEEVRRLRAEVKALRERLENQVEWKLLDDGMQTRRVQFGRWSCEVHRMINGNWAYTVTNPKGEVQRGQDFVFLHEAQDECIETYDAWRAVSSDT